MHWAIGTGANPTTDGADFSGATSGDLIFNVGDAPKTITLNVIGDTVYESGGLAEHFTVVLSNPSGATISGTQGSASEVTSVIESQNASSTEKSPRPERSCSTRTIVPTAPTELYAPQHT